MIQLKAEIKQVMAEMGQLKAEMGQLRQKDDANFSPSWPIYAYIDYIDIWPQVDSFKP